MNRKIATLISVGKSYRQFRKGRKGVYHYHIRKTAGTSLNKALINTYTGLDPDEGYRRLMAEKDLRLIAGDSVIVAHNKFLIEKGNYEFGFSHLPFHRLTIPPDITTITCLRDPVKRVVSHYKMISKYTNNHESYRQDYELEAEWLGEHVIDFVKNMPAEHRERQLFMFSKSFDIKEAIENLDKVNCVLFLEDFSQGIDHLNQLLGKKIPVFHKRKSSDEVKYNYESIKGFLSKEIEFYEAAKRKFQVRR